MEIIWTPQIDSVLNVGRKLDKLGIRNWALGRLPVLKALESLADLGVGVLGGDVYIVVNDTLEPNYDNWYCSRERDDSDAKFLEKSIAKAKY
jgi:hypothetical protein